MIKRICLFFASFLVMLDCIPIVSFQARAEDTDLVESGAVEKDVFSYNLTDGVMTWTFHQDNATITIEDGNCVVDGDVLSFNIFVGLFEEDSEGNEDSAFLAEWMNQNPIDQITFSDNVRKLDTKLFSTWFFRDSFQIFLGNGMEYVGNDALNSYTQIEELILPISLQQIGDNAFDNCVNLTDVTVLSSDVFLDNSGIGYYCGEPLDNMTIRGYRNSPAETYANENGFTFIALDDQITTTITTETTTDIVTTEETGTTTSIENTTTTTETTTDVATTEETGTTTSTENTTTTTETTTDIVTTEETETTTSTGNTTETTETTSITTTTTTDDTTLPQTGYSKWYQTAAALAVCMTGIGGAMVISSGVLKKKRR